MTQMTKREKEKCKVEVFARVTGFFRPVENWNEGKKEEFKDRKHYNIDVVTYDGIFRKRCNNG